MPDLYEVLPTIIGHRGAAGSAPENTIAGITTAAELGVGWVEFDVKLTRDGHAVLLHDDRLERTTNGRGPVAALDFAELRGLDAGSWFSPAFAGERVPTLSEAITALADNDMGANVEIKPSPGRDRATGYAVARALRRHWPDHLPLPLLSSFSESSLVAARDAAPALPRALLVSRRPGNWVSRLERLGCAALHVAQRHVGVRLVRTTIDAGYALRCYTVNDRARAERLLRWGVESVFTDHPERMRR